MQRGRGGGGLSAVLFTDIVSSTSIAAEMGNSRWSELVARHHRIVRQQLERFGGREIDTAGDGFFATFDRPASAIRCAATVAEAVRELGIEIRSGVNFGELEVADGKPSGLAVNTAARLMSAAGAGEVLVPASVRDILDGTSITFEDRGRRRLKGLDRDVRLFRVVEIDGAPVAQPPDSDEAARRRREIFPAGASRRIALAVGVAIGAIAMVVGISLIASDGRPAQRAHPSASLRDSVARIDPTSKTVTATIPLGRQPSGLNFVKHPLAVGEGGVWLLSPSLVFHLDPIHADVRPSEILVGYASTQDIRAGLDAVWVIGGPSTLYRVNPATDELEPFFEPLSRGRTPGALALGDAVWVGLSDGTLVRLDPGTGARDEVHTGYSIDQLAVTSGHVWLLDIIAGALVPVDPASLKVGEPVNVSGTIDQVEGHGDTLWSMQGAPGIVERLSGDTGDVTGTARVGADASDMDVGDGAVWIGAHDGFVYRVDPLTLDVTRIRIGAEVLGVAEDDDGAVWTYLGELT